MSNDHAGFEIELHDRVKTSVSVIRVPLKKDYDSNDHLNEKSESEICPRLKRTATQSGSAGSIIRNLQSGQVALWWCKRGNWRLRNKLALTCRYFSLALGTHWYSNLLYSFGVSIEYSFFCPFCNYICKYLSSVFMWNKSRGLNFCSTIISQTFKSAIIKGPFENTTNFFFFSKLPKTSRNAKIIWWYF